MTVLRTGVSTTGEAAASVTNASLKVGVDITVFVTASITNGREVFVTTTGAGDVAGGTSPSAVGVAYCPHREAFPPHADAARKKEAAIKKLISRFTKLIRG
ncbi:hypothetical protein EHM76_03740 [bacterium]|nr:MAG: hypothetical protein EHM76_03740 [bacterium]